MIFRRMSVRNDAAIFTMTNFCCRRKLWSPNPRAQQPPSDRPATPAFPYTQGNGPNPPSPYYGLPLPTKADYWQGRWDEHRRQVCAFA